MWQRIAAKPNLGGVAGCRVEGLQVSKTTQGKEN